ncbi:MAG TPA: GspE/PulE family protein [Caulobacter sp.]|nr:GspE/PulE family protein [Caulobacter sp.]
MNAPFIDRRAAVIGSLLERRRVDDAAVARAELVAGRTGQPVEQVLNQLGALSDDDLADAYCQVAACELWRPETTPPALRPEELEISADFLRRARILPLYREHRTLVCAACDPLDETALSGLVFAVGGRIRTLAARPGDWLRHFDAVYGGPEAGPAQLDERRIEREMDQVADLGGEGAGARLVASVFEIAIARGASDIHFEPRRHDLRIRLRIDGQLVDHQVVSADLAPAAVSRVKVIANLNLGERRLPQDGRASFVTQGRAIDVRVATSPTVFGETAVLRILDRSAVRLDIDHLGLPAPVAGVLRQAATSPHGLFLVTGPTGSGKTTTLYSLLQTFVDSPKKVLSVEDPVEYHFDHVAQTQVAPHIGLTFASALRSFLRQDPDVILVGEIRDPETAAVAVQAAMTGHFVLASVHANDAMAVTPRLLDMGIEPYQLAAGFRGSAAQRLVRRLCPHCSRARPMNAAEALFVERHGLDPAAPVRDTVGCDRCSQAGFKGRTAIAEAFLSSDRLLRDIAARAPQADLVRQAQADGLVPMARDGCEKALAGITTLEEVMSAVHV